MDLSLRYISTMEHNGVNYLPPRPLGIGVPESAHLHFALSAAQATEAVKYVSYTGSKQYLN